MIRCLFLSAALALSASAAAPLFRAEFKPGLEGWRVLNYENRISLEVRDYCGEHALVVRRADGVQGRETAWELLGAPFKVTPGERLCISVRSRGRGDARLAAPIGFGEKYRAALIWTGSDGKPLHECRAFGFEASTSEWRTRRFPAVVPSGAVSATLSIGVDNPDFIEGDVLAISSVVVGPDVKNRPAAHTTSLRADGVVLCDGKPFFPLVLYGLKACAANGGSMAKAMDDARAAGFNTVQTYFDGTPAKLREFLDLADARGLKAFVRPQANIDGPTVNPVNLPPHRDRPCVLGWYLADDASGHHSPDQLEYRRRLVRSVDSDHLTMQSDTPLVNGVSKYERYVHGTEVFLPQIYRFGRPLSDADGVAYVVRDMISVKEAVERAGRPVKSVWPVLQHFRGWGWTRFPTSSEFRASVYASIAHGARGIALYTYCGANEKNEGIVSSPERWAEAACVMRELNAVSSDLLRADSPRQPVPEVVSGPAVDALGQPSVSVLLKSGPKPLLIAVSSVKEPVRVRFGMKCRAREVFTGRVVESGDGFTDDFAPLGVNVYRLESVTQQ